MKKKTKEAPVLTKKDMAHLERALFFILQEASYEASDRKTAEVQALGRKFGLKVYPT